jgi:hypothetical protein
LNRADTIFGAIRDAAVAAKDIAMEQLPDIAQQFIVYSRVSHTVFFSVGVIFLIVSAVLFLTTKNRESEEGKIFFVLFWFYHCIYWFYHNYCAFETSDDGMVCTKNLPNYRTC